MTLETMEDEMVMNTVQLVGEKLERLSRRNFSISSAIDLLGSRARSVEEQIVIEVMREVYNDMVPQHLSTFHEFSNSRTA